MSVGTTITQVGRLNSVCEIYKEVVGMDDYGFSKDQWEKYKRLRCQVDFDDRLNKIRTGDDGLDAIITKIFTMRYCSNVTCKDRLVYDGRIFDIYAIHYDEKKRYMKLWCRDLECKS